jgi:adenine-specific DNA methylase
MLLALLLPDPSDPKCPGSFRKGARDTLLSMRAAPSGWTRMVETDDGLRRVLLRFIADLANWDRSADHNYLETARGLVRAAHPEEMPLVVDPFAGGGSIPLEALRLGCDTFASDLNPVACFILKVMLEDIPRCGPDLADELRRAGAEIKARAEQELADLYPRDPDGAMPIAYLWARTVRCEAPQCGAEIPLMRSFWLCRKANRKMALRPDIVQEDGAVPRAELAVFEPQTDDEVLDGTVARAKATCLCCGAVLPPERVRSQIAAQSGGADTTFDEDGNRTGGAMLTAVVTLKPGERGRHYRLPTDADYAAVFAAQDQIAAILEEWDRGGQQGSCPVPNESLPPIGTLGFRVQRYGMLQWGDLFTARQKVAMLELSRHLASVAPNLHEVGAASLSRLADKNASLAIWNQIGEKIEHVFGRQALPIVWDFAEVPVFSSATGNFLSGLELVALVIQAWPGSSAGHTQQADATCHPLPDQSADIWFTDPPYYDAVPYADLSDFFLVWLKRSLPDHPTLRDPFDTVNSLSPKCPEAVQDETKQVNGRSKDRAWFEETMAKAFTEGRRVLSNDGIGSVVFAHKTTEGWEALLSGLIRGGWTITGSWPIATERPGRLRAQESAALATSVHLVCRPRAEDAPVGEWADVLRDLPDRVGGWMERLQEEGVRGADLVFACVGPALEIYSRHSAVETAEGREVALPEYLEKVWEVVGREALAQILGRAEAQAQNGGTGALEEDARLTALFLWTMQSTREGADTPDGVAVNEAAEDAVPRPGAHSLPFDVVRRFAQPLGIHLHDWESRIVETTKGVVRLIPVRKRSKQLFGEEGADQLADGIEVDAAHSPQLSLFPEAPPTVRGRARHRHVASVAQIEDLDAPLDATTLDRVHAAMLLQASGRSHALRALLRAEQGRGPDFLRLANALSALYPRGSDEKRLLDAMLLASQ